MNPEFSNYRPRRNIKSGAYVLWDQFTRSSSYNFSCRLTVLSVLLGIEISNDPDRANGDIMGSIVFARIVAVSIDSFIHVKGEIFLPV